MPHGDDDTIPLDPSYREVVVENGRMFQEYSLINRVYCVPIDELETGRLSVQNEVIREYFNHKLFFAYGGGSPENILDCGYGQAQWANEVAETYPDCQVTGIDIFPRNPEDYADNLELLCDDLHKSLLPIFDEDTFDVINSRFMEAGLDKRRWRSYVRELSRLLKPGGSLQMMEYHLNFQSETNTIRESSALRAWSQNYQMASETDREPKAGRYLPGWMQQAGLVDIETRCFALPVGAWGQTARDQMIGGLNLGNFDQLLDSFALYSFTRRLGMTKVQIDVLNQACREEARHPNVRLYVPLYVAWAKKPLQ